MSCRTHLYNLSLQYKKERMEERSHTTAKLVKRENFCRFLLNEDIIDDDSFIDYVTTI